jgi:non-heme chloroperoxidase
LPSDRFSAASFDVTFALVKTLLAVPLVVSMVATLTAQATDPSPHTVAMVSVAGVRVPYLDWGGAGPALVFVAGLGNSAHVFDDFAPRFAKDHRVLAVTRTGYGEADQPERDGYDIATRVAHIRAALDAAGIAKAVLVGHSLGGDEITAFAVAHADRTAAVIYVDAAMDHAATLQRVTDLGPQLPVPPDITREERTTAEAFRGYYRRTMGVDLPIGEVIALTIPTRSGLLGTRSQPRIATAISAATVPPEFARVQAPMLALYSESTAADAFPWVGPDSPDYARGSALFAGQLRPMILEERQKFARAATSARIETFPAHHYMFLSHPAETERRMRAFLSPARPR